MIDMNNREQVINKLAELKAANLPKMSIESFKKCNLLFEENIEKATEEERAAIEEHLSTYYDQTIVEDSNCLFTGEEPRLEWGLAHGQMYDTKTGLSWTYYHYLTIDGKRERYRYVLQYHPDNYDIQEEE